ncbi:MAG TPA: hypothetical protein VGT98_00925, partial [Candidatus Elarobacter sp.]|nr:hypothetical protein [Candidatus Elarobacter sp.]
ASVAQHVLSVIRDARAENLPADAVENRSLKFAARGVAPDDIARAADEQVSRMRTARDVLRKGRAQTPTGDEIEAGAEALREGVDGAAVSALARSAPSGRSLTVPLYVIGSLVSRGLPSDDALARVRSRLEARASDADIQKDGQDVAASHRGPNNGRGIGEGGRRDDAGDRGHGGGPPAGVPGNAGAKGRPSTAGGNGSSKPGKGRP